MPALTSCQPCCSVPVATNVPGPQGAGGSNGTNGTNAYTTLTATLTVPAVNATVASVAVADSSWMVYGQTLAVGDAGANKIAEFQLVAIHSSVSIDLKFLGYPGNVAPTGTLPSGSRVGPSGRWGLPSPLTAYAAGTGYQLTATPALLNFGTTDPVKTLAVAGTYLIFSRAKIDYNAATFAAQRTVTLVLRQTNNPAGYLSDSTASFKTPIITTQTYTAAIVALPPVVYTTPYTTDVIELWGSIDVVPDAGSIDAVQAEIVALRIA